MHPAGACLATLHVAPVARSLLHTPLPSGKACAPHHTDFPTAVRAARGGWQQACIPPRQAPCAAHPSAAQPRGPSLARPVWQIPNAGWEGERGREAFHTGGDGGDKEVLRTVQDGGYRGASYTGHSLGQPACSLVLNKLQQATEQHISQLSLPFPPLLFQLRQEMRRLKSSR